MRRQHVATSRSSVNYRQQWSPPNAPTSGAPAPDHQHRDRNLGAAKHGVSARLLQFVKWQPKHIGQSESAGFRHGLPVPGIDGKNGSLGAPTRDGVPDSRGGGPVEFHGEMPPRTRINEVVARRHLAVQVLRAAHSLPRVRGCGNRLSGGRSRRIGASRSLCAFRSSLLRARSPASCTRATHCRETETPSRPSTQSCRGDRRGLADEGPLPVGHPGRPYPDQLAQEDDHDRGDR